MIRDLYPTDGTNPYARMEQLDVDMRVMLIDLGSDEQVRLTAVKWSCRAVTLV